MSQPTAIPTTPAVTTGGVGGGDRIFPPSGGLSFTTWILVNRYSTDDPAPQLTLLSLSHTVSTKNKKVSVKVIICACMCVCRKCNVNILQCITC